MEQQPFTIDEYKSWKSVQEQENREYDIPTQILSNYLGELKINIEFDINRCNCDYTSPINSWSNLVDFKIGLNRYLYNELNRPN